MKASVVIPTKNGEAYLEEVLTAVFAQETDFSFEVVVVDSGSTDRTLEILARFPVRLLRIPPQEFNHGETRNRAIRETDGDFVALLTQDATPAGSSWLACLVAAFEDPRVAGVFGPHHTRPDCDPIETRNLVAHFRGFGETRTRYEIRDQADYRAHQGVYDFFSNCNSCLSRTVWEQIPFRRTEMSEDQMWAQDVLQAGYVKVFEPAAAVYHSHTYTPWGFFMRAFDEYRSYEILGNPGGFASLRQIFPHVFKEIAREVRYIWRMDDLELSRKVYWTWQFPWINLARKVGGYCGTNHRRWPAWLQQAFSMQAANRRRGSRRSAVARG